MGVKPERVPTAGCLFSGMGGFAAGLAEAGFAIRWANDNDEFACAAFRHRFPGVAVVQKDVRQLAVQRDSLSGVDLLAAGFPCQSFSQAGGRRGFEDPRGEVFFEIPRLLGEFAPNQRPALVVLENVPHLLHGGEGAWFDHVRRALRRAGYWFRVESCWTVNVMDYTELPQDRERLFLVAASRVHFCHNPFVPPTSTRKQQPERLRLDQIIDRTRRGSDDMYLAPQNRYYKMIDSSMTSGESASNIFQLRRSYVREKKKRPMPNVDGQYGHRRP